MPTLLNYPIDCEMKKTAIAFYLILLSQFVTSCIVDEVKITMTPQDMTPVFHFKYINRPDKPVKAHIISIYESTFPDGNRPDLERLVWDIARYDYSLANKKNGEVDGHELSTLVFGEVPAGFGQFYPQNNEKPLLKRNVRYIIWVESDIIRISGMTEFTDDRECRKISGTPFTRDLPAFSAKDNCLD